MLLSCLDSVHVDTGEMHGAPIQSVALPLVVWLVGAFFLYVCIGDSQVLMHSSESIEKILEST